MLKRIALTVALLAAAAFGQLQRFDSTATAVTGQPGSIQLQAVLPGSTVYVCTGSTQPCSAPGTASLYSDIAGTVPLPQPLNADASGKFGFYWSGATITWTATPPQGSIGAVQSATVTSPLAAQQISVSTPQPAAPSSVTVTPVGTTGGTTYYYWVVSNFTIGNSAPSLSAVITNAAATLSTVNYDKVAWTTVTGANTYDVLRTATATVPSGACACAVATSVNALTANDQSNSLSAYTVSTYAGNTTFNITNTAVGAGESQLTFAADHGTKLAIDNINGPTFTGGAINPQTLDHIYFADTYATDWGAAINAASAACGANCLIVYRPLTTVSPLTSTTQVVLAVANQALFLGPGTYVENASGAGKAAILIEASGVSVYGPGAGATTIQMGTASEDDVIRACNGAYNSSVQGPCAPLYDVSVHDLTVDGNQPNTTAYGNDTFQNGINLNTCSRCSVYHTHTTRTWAQGILIAGADYQNATGTVDTSGTSVTLASGNDFLADGNWTGRQIQIGTTWYQIASVTSGTALTLTTSAGTQSGSAYFVITNDANSIADNVVDRFGEIGIGLEANVNHTVITGNRVTNAVANSEFTENAIGIADIGSGYTNWGNTIRGNTVANILQPTAAGVGVLVGGATVGATVAGNVVDSTGVCVKADWNNFSDNLNTAIRGNACSNSSVTSGAIEDTGKSDGASSGHQIVGNTITNATFQGLVTSYLSSPQIANNAVLTVGSANSNGVVVQHSTRAQVADNLVSGATFGFVDTSGSHDAWSGNFVGASVTTPFSDSGTDDQYLDPDGSGGIAETLVGTHSITSAAVNPLAIVGASSAAVYATIQQPGIATFLVGYETGGSSTVSLQNGGNDFLRGDLSGNATVPGTLGWGGGTAISSSSDVALASKLAGAGSITTTSATSDSVTIAWPDGGSRTPGHCGLSATNSSAATNIATVYISAKAANAVTLTHTATTGMTYDVVCTAN